MKKILILSSLIFLGFVSNYVLAAEMEGMAKGMRGHGHKCTTNADCHGKHVCVNGYCEKQAKKKAPAPAPASGAAKAAMAS